MPYEKVTANELMKHGGDWLSAARTFLQCNVKNGDRVIWSSNETLTMTVRQIETLVAQAVAAALNAERAQRSVGL